MKNIIVTLIVIACTVQVGLSSPITPEAAKNYAQVAFAKKSHYNFRTAKDIEVKSQFTKDFEGEPSFYVFNMEPKGFVIVSADDRYNAILAFSEESNIDFDNEEVNLGMWGSLSRHEQRIDYVRKHDIKPSPAVQKEWAELKSNKISDYINRDPDGMVVAPLTTTTWNQGKYYNAHTPESDSVKIDNHTYLGCVPVATAQVMNFHNYPLQGNGYSTYTDSIYGDQSADFCNTTYDWPSMQDSLTDYNDNVAELIYQVGVATRTEYSPVYTSTFVSYVRDALVGYFGYDESAEWFYDANDDFSWVAIQDLNKGLPVILSGTAFAGSVHAWVADGYGYFSDPGPDQPDEYFHYNWGWGGDNNGWFLDTGGSWAPIPFETGTQLITYYWDRFVIHNIKPASSGCPSPSSLRNSAIAETTTFIFSTYSLASETVKFRWREANPGNNPWIEVLASGPYYHYLSGLKPGTEYEFQAQRSCCPGQWSEYSNSEFFTTEGVQVEDACASFLDSDLQTNSITENSAYVYTSRPYGDDNLNQFRYRFQGATLWTYTPAEKGYSRLLSNLEDGTQYEYQVRHQCAAGTWVNFSPSQTFTTKGPRGCEIFGTDNLLTSSVTRTTGYIYTSQPYGKVTNEFRYRPISSSTWEATTQTESYYRGLTNLTPGTEYEFQVRHMCSANEWSVFSFSHTLTTIGDDVSCDPIPGERLYTSTVSQNNAYVYTPQPYGTVSNMFRYREVGTADWVITYTSTQYYRYLRNMKQGTTYEFQVRHECNIGQWTDYSESQVFTTALGFVPGNNDDADIAPAGGEAFDEWDVYAQDNKEEDLAISLYPNPASDILHLNTSVPFNRTSVVTVISISGQKIQEFTPPEGTTNHSLQVAQLDSGIYFIQVVQDGNIDVQKIIIR